VRTSEVWIYNNGKHWALKQHQVMSSFAPRGTTGWPLPCDERVPHDKAGFMPVAVRAVPVCVLWCMVVSVYYSIHYQVLFP